LEPKDLNPRPCGVEGFEVAYATGELAESATGAAFYIDCKEVSQDGSHLRSGGYRK
jgi:hypothetical protein